MTIHYAEPALVILAYNNVEIEKLPMELGITDDEALEVLAYLKQIEAVEYDSLLCEGLSSVCDLRITAKGLEIASQKRPLVDTTPTVSQHVTNSHIQNLVQSTGNSNVINQSIDNSKHYILRQMIEQDPDLDSEKKKSLFNILERFNTLKEGGENAFELLKIVANISLKYVPLFFGILN